MSLCTDVYRKQSAGFRYIKWPYESEVCYAAPALETMLPSTDLQLCCGDGQQQVLNCKEKEHAAS